MTDNEQLKIELLKACGGDVAAADAALEWLRPTRTIVAPVSAKPATKTVEVWRIEYAWLDCATDKWMPCSVQYTSEEMVRSHERGLGGNAACIHVTGPHSQTIPA